MFIVRNSWGSQWGDKGYCYIPYDYVIHQDYNGHDSWIIKSVRDLDFSTEVWEEDESVFAEEGSLLLFDFYITTFYPEGFIKDLENLCLNYIQSEEEHYFDYEYSQQDDESFVLNILNFDLIINDATQFLQELDALCNEYAIDGNYNYCIEGAEQAPEWQVKEMFQLLLSRFD